MSKQKKPRPRSKNAIQPKARGARLNNFARSLLREWNRLELPMADATVIVAVSGGADSVALLLAVDELITSQRLKPKIVVAHLNHKLRGKVSDADARWVTALSKKLGYAVVTRAVNVKKRAAKSGDNLEQS